MKNLYFLTLIIFSTIAFSCNYKGNQKTLQDSKVPIIPDLAGKVLYFGPELDPKTCEVGGACGCCAWRILLIDEQKFVGVAYCDGDDSYWKGQYEIKDNILYLSDDKLLINSIYNWPDDSDSSNSDIPDYSIEIDTMEQKRNVVKPYFCNKTLAFEIQLKEKCFGIIDSSVNIADEIEGIKSLGIWDMLK